MVRSQSLSPGQQELAKMQMDHAQGPRNATERGGPLFRLCHLLTVWSWVKAT